MDSRAKTVTDSACDCCGRPFPASRLSPASAAPEMTVCADCRHQLERESRDRSRGTLSKSMRRLGDALRGLAMKFELQETRLLGPVLRWIDRRSPW